MLTNCLIKQILLKPEMFGRLAKLAIELEEHEISYRPETNIKGQALADFLLEILDDVKEAIHKKESSGTDQPKDSQRWTLYTDGASSKEGSGACVIITSLGGRSPTPSALIFIPLTMRVNMRPNSPAYY